MNPQLQNRFLDRHRQRYLNGRVRKLFAALDTVITGHKMPKRLLVLALAANGHILLDAVPGVGKTTLGKILQAALGAGFARVQHTVDLKPSDLLGTLVFNPQTGKFEYKKGPIIGPEVLVADEINRALEMTQSGWLQALDEGFITIDGVRYDLADPFLVIATKNPLESAGVMPLLEPLLDRFLFSVLMNHVSETDETEMLMRRKVHDGKHLHELVEPAMTLDDVRMLQGQVKLVVDNVSRPVANYIVRLCRAMRPDDESFGVVHGEQAQALSHKIHTGPSPRRQIATLHAAAALAYLKGRQFVDFADVQDVVGYTVRHGIVLTSEGQLMAQEGFSVDQFVKDVVARVPLTRTQS
jgi:MoxR-like ATPase